METGKSSAATDAASSAHPAVNSDLIDANSFISSNQSDNYNNLNMMRSRGGSWEDLRKHARQLENDIDAKLVKLSQIGQSRSNGLFPSASNSNNADKIPLLQDQESGGGTDANTFQEQVSDLERCLSALASVNEAMGDLASSNTNPSGSAMIHTLQRHRDILLDYRQEFSKTKSNVASMLERESLFNSGGSSSSNHHRNPSKTDSLNRRMDLLMKENEHARNSERLIDDQINIALESRDALVKQRMAFKAIQTKLVDISNRFPMINNLVQKINLRKKRDSIILGLVIGLCIFFMMWYTFG